MAECTDWFVVESRSGYALLEWMGGYTPIAGDEVVGEFETFGRQEIYRVGDGRETQVWVQDYWMSARAAAEAYVERCD